MDIATGLGMFVSDHAVIVIFGGSFAATLIRFPLSSIFHGLPLGMKFVFSMRRISQRELVDEIAGLAEIARKQGPIGLEKVEVEDPYLARASASSPTATTPSSSATILSATATIF